MPSLGMCLQVTVALRCRVCQQLRDSERVAHSIINVALFGRIAYAQCPSCQQEVSTYHDRNYRARVRRFIAKNTTHA